LTNLRWPAPKQPQEAERLLSFRRSELTSFRMNTYKNAPVTPFRMSTCGAKDLKSLCFQHLQKKGRGGWAIRARPEQLMRGVNQTSCEGFPFRSVVFEREISSTSDDAFPRETNRFARTTSKRPKSFFTNNISALTNRAAHLASRHFHDTARCLLLASQRI